MADASKPKVGLLGLTLEFYEQSDPKIRQGRERFVRERVLPALDELAEVRFDGAVYTREDIRRTVIAPKLTVVLDAPVNGLVERMERQGPPGERRLIADALERIRQAILTEACQPGRGPVLRLAGDGPEQILLEEVLGAVEAMR